MSITLYNQTSIEELGFLPEIFQADDPRPAAAQAEERYARGGGWRPFNGFTFDPVTRSLKYSGDPDLFPLASFNLPLSNERLFVYPYAWVCVLNLASMEREVCRMD